MNVVTGLTGPFPRSEALVQATRDLDRGRTTPEAVEALYEQSEGEVLALEQKLGLEPATGGDLRSPDLFRPYAEAWGGLTVGPVVRWFETNTFFRQPILHAPPERQAGNVALRTAIGSDGKARFPKVILPGPYTFGGLLDNRSGETQGALTYRLGRLLSEEAKELRQAGVTTFQFQDPLLVTSPPKGALAEAVVAAYRLFPPAIDGGTSMVWTFFGDGAAAAPLLSRLSVDVVGVDLAETNVTELTPLRPRSALGLGCVDPHTTLVEDPEEIAGVARQAAETTEATTIWLGPGAPLDLLPWEPAAQKLEVLPKAKQRLAGLGGRK
jgi:5-methyltetrahydropteroyltriglutamate--homocysteine methyltransferase